MPFTTPETILYNEDGTLLAVSQSQVVSSALQPGIMVAGSGSDGRAHFFRVENDGTLHITGSIVTSTSSRSLTGSYFCATNLITGTTSSQTLFTITNPVGSTRTIYIKRAVVRGVASTTSTTAFLYRFGRTFNTPTSGTILPSQAHSTTDASASAVIRQSPIVTLSSGSMWTGCPGILNTSVGFTGMYQDPLNVNDELGDIILAPSQSVAFSADANTTAWRHYGQFFWHEV